MKKTISTLVLLFVLFAAGIAQDNVYYTQQANLQVNGKFKSKTLLGQSQNLIVKLDYETTEITLRFNLNSISFNNDTINKLLSKINEEIIFHGEFSLEYINTEGHPPLDFEVEGWFDLSGTKTKIVGKGQLYHISDSGRLACMLSMTTTINLKNLGVDIPDEMYEEVELSITQALLDKSKN